MKSAYTHLYEEVEVAEDNGTYSFLKNELLEHSAVGAWALFRVKTMVHVCAVPGCSNQSDRESNLTYHSLPLQKKTLLKQWIHRIGQKNLPLNSSTQVCSQHFVSSKGRKLWHNEVPSLKLPSLPTNVHRQPLRRPLLRHHTCSSTETADPVEVEISNLEFTYSDAAVNTDLTMVDIEEIESQLREVKEELLQVKSEVKKQQFRVENISDDDDKIKFYTGFSNLHYSLHISIF